MLISRAMAAHFTPDSGNSGGGDTLLIILGVGIALGLAYAALKKWRQRVPARQANGGSQDG